MKAEGAKHLSEALKANSSLKELKCAASPPESCSQQPLTPRLRLPRSLWNNSIGAEGAKHLSEALKTNSTLKDLKCAAPARNPAVSSR